MGATIQSNSQTTHKSNPQSSSPSLSSFSGQTNGNGQPTTTKYGGGALLTVRQAAQRFQLHPNTLRSWTATGKVKALRTIGGHRRFRAEDLLAALGVDPQAQAQLEEEKKGSNVPLALVCRVSSRGQATRKGQATQSSLEHQIERVESYVTNRWGSQALKEASKYYRIGGGLQHDNPILLRLCQDILEGKFRGGYVVAQDDLRVMRFGLSLFSKICEFGGVKEIVYTHPQEATDSESDLTNSVLGCITHFTAVKSGLVARKLLLVELDPESLKEAYHLYRSGYSYRQIEKEFEGRTDDKGRPYTHNVIRTNLKRGWDSLSALFPNGKDGTGKGKLQSSFSIFVKEKVKKGSEKDRLSRKTLIKEYKKWCRQRGVAVMDPRKITPLIRKWGWGSKYSNSGTVMYSGLVVVGVGESGSE